MDDKTQDDTKAQGVAETPDMQSFSEPEVIRPQVDPNSPPSVLKTSGAEEAPTLNAPVDTPVATTYPAAQLGQAPIAPQAPAEFPQMTASGFGEQPQLKGKLKSKLMLPLVLGLVLLLGGGAAAYVTVFQKTPEKLWSRALSNTVEGLDTMLQTGFAQQDKATKMEGSVKVESPIAVDATMSGNLSEKNGTFTADVSASGVRMNAEVRSVTKDGAKTPDIYVKVDGLDQIGALLGSAVPGELDDTIANINDQWFFLDHTLIDQYLSAAGASGDEAMTLTKEDADKIADKMMVVMRDRFFASNEKGVFTLSEKVGKEKFEDTESYKVKVAVNKDNFKQFVVELKDAIKDTKLEELLKASSPDKSLEEVLDFDKMLEELDKADFSKATADVWIEANGGYIRNVRIYPMENNTSNYLDFGLNYTGGDMYPLAIKATIDDDGTKGTLALGMSVNAKNADAEMTMNVDMTSDDSPIKMNMKMTLTGTNDEPKVDEPEGATNVLELLGSLQGSDSLSSEESMLNDYQSLEESILDDQQLQ